MEVGEQVGSTFLSDQPRYLDDKTVRVESGWLDGWIAGWVRKVRWMVLMMLDGVWEKRVEGRWGEGMGVALGGRSEVLCRVEEEAGVVGRQM